MTTYFIGEWYADNAIMYSILDSLTLYIGNVRAGSKFFLKTKKKVIKPVSCKFGTTWRQKMGTKNRTICPLTGRYKTKLYDEEEYLIDVFKEFSEKHLNNFTFTDVTINKLTMNNAMRKHKDKTNVGDSCLVAFGDYKGGNTFVNEKGKDYTIYDCRDHYIKFNGSEKYHFVNSVKSGLRYSLVFYSSIKQ